MIVKVSELEETGVTIESPEALGSVFSDPAWRLDAVTLSLLPDDREVSVQGNIRAIIPLTCGRCLETFSAPVETEVDLRVLPRPAAASDAELGREDLDVDFYEGDDLNVARLVEAETTLALPMKPLCRPDCRGLCPVCGGNRNVAPCQCQERPPDPRLAVLKELGNRFST